MALTKPIYRVNDGKVFELFGTNGTMGLIYTVANTAFEEVDLTSGDYTAYWGETNDSAIPIPSPNQNVIPAKLAKWDSGSAEPIDVGLTAVIFSGNIIRIATTSAVPEYVNGQGLKGKWVGVGIEIPTGTDLSKTIYAVAHEPTASMHPLNQTGPDLTENGKDYIEFYFDISADQPKNFISVSWNGTPGSRQIYRVDYAGVMV